MNSTPPLAVFLVSATLAAIGATAAAAVTPLPLPAIGTALQDDDDEEPSLPTLWVGDPAPALGEHVWLGGEGADALESGKVYVVVTCGSSTFFLEDELASITEFQRAWAERGVTVLASMCGSELDDTPAEGLAQAREFVEAHRDEIDFAIGFEADGKTDTSWRQAAQRVFAPNYFLVDGDGKIAWIGDFVDGMAPTLSEVLDGKHDLQAAAKAYREEFLFELRVREHSVQLEMAWEFEEWDQVVECADRLLEIDPVRMGDAAGSKFLALALGLEKVDEAYAFARKFITGPGKNSPIGLNLLAWFLVDPDLELPNPDLDLALRAAQQAVKLTEEEDADTLDTLAMVHRARGDLDRAIEFARRAAALDEAYAERVAMLESEKDGV